MFRHLLTLTCAAIFGAATAMPIPARAAPLITEEEAGVQTSPMRFQVKFQTFGGSSIDLDALKVTYLKSPVVDLTARIRPFALPTGIDMPDALLPPGDHLLRIDIKDSDGRVSSISFLLKIAP